MTAEPIHVNAESEATIWTYRRLWQSVILQAIRDALLTRTELSGSEDIAKHQAANWLRGGTKDFAEVCSNAGLDHTVVSDWFKSIEANLDNITSIRASLMSLDKDGTGLKRLGGHRIAAE